MKRISRASTFGMMWCSMAMPTLPVCIYIGRRCMLWFTLARNREKKKKKTNQPRLQTVHVDTGSTQSDVIRSKKTHTQPTLTPFMRVAMCDTTHDDDDDDGEGMFFKFRITIFRYIYRESLHLPQKLWSNKYLIGTNSTKRNSVAKAMAAAFVWW